MKLLLKKTHTRSCNSDVNITKSGIYLQGDFCDSRNITNKQFIAFGLDDNDRISIFITSDNDKMFLKLVKTGRKELARTLTVSINANNKKVMSNFIGQYIAEYSGTKNGISIYNLIKK